MRFRNPSLHRPFRIPLYPIPPLISLGIGGWLVASAIMENWVPVLATGITIALIIVLRPILTAGLKPS